MKWWWLISIVLILSCTNITDTNTSNNENDSATDVHAGAMDTIARSSIALQSGCYAMMVKRNTATLSLQIQDTLISGNLTYRWAEKDHNKGTIKGVIRDSLLIADYTFESEGMTSVREVVFKLRGDTILQGYGELGEQNNKVILTRKDKLQYDTAFPFIKVNCQDLRQ